MARMMVLSVSVLVLCSGFACFLLEKDWFKRISYMLKVPLYMILGITLSFTISCSLVDIVTMGCDRCRENYKMPLVWAQQQIFLILAGAMVIGAAVGLMFGVMDVEDHLAKIRYEGWVLVALSSVCGFITGAANAVAQVSNDAGMPNERSQLHFAT